MMTGVEAITFTLAAALALCAIAVQASLSSLTALALQTLPALGLLLALLHRGRRLRGGA